MRSRGRGTPTTTHDYSFVDRIFGPTALTPEQEPEPYQTIPLASAEA